MTTEQNNIFTKEVRKDTQTEIKWFVMRDLKRPNAKTPGYKQMAELGFEVYTPLQWKVCDKNGRRVRVQCPVIHDLLFIHGVKEEIENAIKNINTMQFRYQRGAYLCPMVVPDREMEMFLKASGAASDIKFCTPDEITPAMLGREVKVVGGAIDGVQGKIIKIRGSKNRHILIELPGLVSAVVKIASDLIEFVD